MKIKQLYAYTGAFYFLKWLFIQLLEFIVELFFIEYKCKQNEKDNIEKLMYSGTFIFQRTQLIFEDWCRLSEQMHHKSKSSFLFSVHVSTSLLTVSVPEFADSKVKKNRKEALYIFKAVPILFKRHKYTTFGWFNFYFFVWSMCCESCHFTSNLYTLVVKTDLGSIKM